MSESIQRRDFLARVCAGAAAAAVAPAGGALGSEASETIRVACIGLGGRCRRLAEKLVGIPRVAVGDHFLFAGKREAPDTVHAAFRFPKNQVQTSFESSVINSRFDGSMELMGTEATMYLDRGRYEIHPERGAKVPASELAVGTGTRGAADYREINAQYRHLKNWIDCIRSRGTPNAPVEESAQVAAIAHLANRALRQGVDKATPRPR